MRTSPVYYIAPSAISITPNANGSANDLAVYVAKGCTIKVYSPRAGLDYQNGAAQEWTMAGRNRRLAESGKPYTIYVRLMKKFKDRAYLVFAAKELVDGEWRDAYPYITPDGETGVNTSEYWYIRIGDVSLPENGLRTVTYDTGILGTDQFNTEWALNPDALPLRVDLGCTIDDEDAGPTPYVFWNKSAVLVATLVEGWTGTMSERFDHWEIFRDSGIAAADAEWNAIDRSATFGATGMITLSHGRTPAVDDFNGAVNTTFTVRAMGRSEDTAGDSTEMVVLSSGYITIMAETLEKYELVLSTSFVSFNPMSGAYTPAEGVTVNLRATDQRGDVVKITKGQLDAAGLTVSYQHADSHTWTNLPFNNPQASVAEAVIPIAAFEAQKAVNVHVMNPLGMELHFRDIAFLRDGEDSRDREWVYIRSEVPVTFGDAQSEHPAPSLIEYGEVEPGEHAAGHVTNEKNQDGWVPEGWWDEMQGTDDTYHYEYAAYRDYVRADSESETEAHWGDFSKPTIWSYSAEDAVSYRCRWTLDNTEVWQLVASYNGAFRGTFPLICTLMKRKGNDNEEAVTATSTVITLQMEGLGESYTFTDANPQLVISEADTPDIVEKLNNKNLTGLSVSFAVDGRETFSFSIPVVREADEDAIIETLEERGGELFLSKKNDDTANGFITFAKGFLSLADVVIRGVITAAEGVMNTVRSSNYTGDGIGDTGFRLTSDDGTGSSALTVDNLHVRKKATFEELEVKKETSVAGNEIRSAAANVINRTDYIDQNGEIIGYSYHTVPWMLRKMPFLLRHKFFGRLRRVRITIDPEHVGDIKKIRCYFLAKDGDRDVKNLWQAHDLVRCQTFNISRSNRYTYIGTASQSKFENVFWWRKAVAVSSSPVTIDDKEYHYFDVSMTDCAAGSDIPCAGDHAVQFGNDSDSERMNLIIQEVNGDDASAIKAYTGIYTYDLNKCWWGGSPRKMMLSPKSGYEFYGPSFKFVQEYGQAPASIDRGAWVDIPTERDDYEPHAQVRKCYYYDKVSHNGCYWLCVFTVEGDGAHWVDANGNYISDDDYADLPADQKLLCTRKQDYITSQPGTDDTAWKKLVDKGDNMVRLDIDNEMDTVQTDSTGKVTAQRTVTTVVRLYDGSSEVAIDNPTVTGIVYTDGDGHQQTLQPTITASGNGRQLSWTFQTGWTLQGRYQISIGYTYQNVPYTAVFTLTASQGMAIFQLKPAMNAISFQRDADGNLTPASRTLSLKVVKIDGLSTTEYNAPVTGLTIRYSFTQMPAAANDGRAWPNNNSLTVANDKENVFIALFNIYDGLIDRESVPVIKDGEKGEKGDKMTFDDLTPEEKEELKGDNGADGYTVTIEPASLVINQGEGGVYDISSTNPAYFKPKVTKGTNTTNLVTAVAVTGNYCVKNNNVAIVNAGTWSSANGLPVTGVNTTAITNKYTQGYLVLRITADSKTFSITIPIAVNYLASYIETIVDGKKTEIAQETVTIIKDDGTFVENNKDYQSVKTAAESAESWTSAMETEYGTVSKMNQRISNANGNLDRVEKHIPAPNLFDSTDWVYNNPTAEKVYPLAEKDTANNRFYDTKYNDIYSPIVRLEAGTYTFSAYVRYGEFDRSANSFAINYASSGDPRYDGNTLAPYSVGTVSGETKIINGIIYYRRYAVFTINDTYNVSINLWGTYSSGVTISYADVAYPKLEKGTVATNYFIDSASVIKQTADEIDASVRNDLNERVGIDIRGNNRSVNIQADSVNMNRSTIGGTPTMTLQSSDSAQKIVFETTPVTDPMTGQSISGYREWYGYAATTTLGGVSGDFLSLGARVKSDGSGEGRLVLDEAYVSNGEPKVRYEADMEGDYLRFRHANDTGSIDGTIEIGLDGANAYLKASNWPSHNSNMSSGRVYIDANGYLRVKGNASYLPEGAIPTNASTLRRVGSSTTLDGTYETIICTTNNITLTLPSNPVNGQKYTIIPNNGITLRCGNSQHDMKAPDGDIMTSKWLEGPKFHFLIFDATDKRWYLDWGS